jgi:hypothetical protein
VSALTTPCAKEPTSQRREPGVARLPGRQFMTPVLEGCGDFCLIAARLVALHSRSDNFMLSLVRSDSSLHSARVPIDIAGIRSCFGAFRHSDPILGHLH